jgi:hypothetical protein
MLCLPILPFYDNEMCSLLAYVIYTLEYLKFRCHTYKRNGLVFCLILQKSREDGILLFYQSRIHNCCERILLFLRNMFKFLGHNQFLEIRTTSEEIVLFHDNGFVLFRFARGFN